LAVVAVALLPGVARAQDTVLEVGETATRGPFTAVVTATTEADEYEGIPGAWLLVDVRIASAGDAAITHTPLLDWQITHPSGARLYPFPSQTLLTAGGSVPPGEVREVTLGFTSSGLGGGPATLQYQPFGDDIVGVWSVVLPGESQPGLEATPLPEPGAAFDLIQAGPIGQGGEQIVSFDAVYDIQADGSILVTETIEYDFGVVERRGIFREVATRQRFSEEKDRRYGFELLGVDADRGAPNDTKVTQEGDFTRVRIGKEDVFITGPHTYTIRYHLDRVLNPQTTLDELYWNVTGNRWSVAMADVSITVTAPQGVARVACFAGSVGSSEACTAASLDNGTARFQDDGLFPGEELTIVAGLPKGSVAVAAPDLVDPPKTGEEKLLDALDPGVGDVIGAALVGVAGTGTALVLAARRGRDLQAAGSAVEAVVEPGTGPGRRVGLLERVETPVEFEPPDGIRPGLVGTLFDEQADTVDVTATIVDLAVRGYLRIEEIPKEGWFGKGDHRLVRLRESDDLLLTYERRLLDSLFGGDAEVELSDLKDTFATKLAKVQESMYAEVVRRRWFERRPDKTRAKWSGLGVLILLAGGGLAVLGAIFSQPAWPGGALFLVGLVFLLLARFMPRRTAQGTAVNRRVQGFRRFIVDSEVHRALFAERMNLFTDYLPYAMVFGAVEKWTKTFADLNDGDVPVGGWYVGTHAFSASSFNSSMSSFSASAGSSMSSTPGGSGGSGFSGGGAGGGGGGGGGGSW
jgi:hypothetical protein